MSKFLWIGLGGGVGAMLRYGLGGLVQGWTGSTTFPYGTLAVNVIGCFVIGLLGQLGDARGVFSPESRLLIFTGILGGFTTFSTFGAETLDLARTGQWKASGWYVAGNVLIGLAAVWAGRTVAQWLWR